MTISRYHILSITSGCIWAGIGYFLGREFGGDLIWGGVIASPVIGLVVGVVYWHCCGKSLPVRLLASLGTLYLAAALFGLSIGIGDAFFRIQPNRIWWAVIVQAINATLWGITITGFFLVLWPLAFINHSLVCRWGRRSGHDPL